jgi:hypothetical protein
MRRIFLPAIALALSVLPLAWSQPAQAAAGAPAVKLDDKGASAVPVYWRGGGRWHGGGHWRGAHWRGAGYWHRPYWRRYGAVGYWHRPYWRRYGFYRPYATVGYRPYWRRYGAWRGAGFRRYGSFHGGGRRYGSFHGGMHRGRRG